MTQIQSLELRVLRLVPTVDLRSTLARSAELGQLLSEAKAALPHGQFGQFLARVGLHARTARVHMQVYSHAEYRQTHSAMTIERFLATIRSARIAALRADRAAVREAAAERLGSLPDAIALHHADARTFPWPKCHHIVGDPPWVEMDDYRWLAEMAMDRLHPGGTMLVQCGTGHLGEVMRIIGDAGLSYGWCLAVGYAEMRGAKPTGVRFMSAWKPIVLYSKGPLQRGDYMGDIYMLSKSDESKSLHDWQQSKKALKYWIERLAAPGDTILDPFAGSGTTGEIAHEIGCRWVGTERDAKHYKVARGRLAGLKQEVPA